jgi:thiaminase (transcriptional activator TenA)
VLHIMSQARSVRASTFLRERGKCAWQAATMHPMVREIAAGTLGHETFRRYFQQNILYLSDYARAIGLIIGKSPDLAATSVLSRFLQQIAGTEIPANLAFLERLGGVPPGPECMLPTTYAYTSHLLASCSIGTCAEGLAAVLPCQWSYGELAGPLMAAPPGGPICAEWIAMFSSPGYGGADVILVDPYHPDTTRPDTASGNCAPAGSSSHNRPFLPSGALAGT